MTGPIHHSKANTHNIVLSIALFINNLLKSMEQKEPTRKFKASNRKVLSSAILDTKFNCHILIIGDLIL